MLNGARRKVVGSVAAVVLAGFLSAAGVNAMSTSPAAAHEVGWDDGGNWRTAYAGYDGTIYTFRNEYWCWGHHRDQVTYPSWSIQWPTDWHVGWYRPIPGFTSNGVQFWTCSYGY
jgi:hypothetical protein